MPNLEDLRVLDPHTQTLNVIIESPKGSRNKFTYDPKRELFVLSKVLPAGAIFPFDMGFLPSTQGEDGDPLDMLVLMDDPAFPGCLIPSRLIGVIEAEQTERDGQTQRNDRLIAVSAQAHTHSSVQTLADLNDNFVTQIEHFFVSYNQIAGKAFKPTGRFGPERAQRLIDEGMQRLADQTK